MDVSGNTLTVYEAFVHLSVGEYPLESADNTRRSLVFSSEILATLTVMRHIEQYNI